jgi:predicted phage-related endonuclease
MDQDFSQESRASAWWATDSRRAVSGHLIDVLLEKRGEKERDDLSEVEAVQMGLKMQPVIAKLFEEATGIGTQELEIAGTHKTEPWLRAHFDFSTNDGGLLEVKNFNAALINKYSEPDEPIKLPEADYIQCLHEATVYDVDHVYFAVLFGGQRFRWWRLEFDSFQKEDFLKRAAAWWAMCVNKTLPPADWPDQARLIWKHDDGSFITANSQVEQVCQQLKVIKDQRRALEEREEQYIAAIQNYMGNKAILETMAGETLATWKSAKSSKRFDADLLKKAMPNIYDQFFVEKSGSRRFLIK